MLSYEFWTIIENIKFLNTEVKVIMTTWSHKFIITADNEYYKTRWQHDNINNDTLSYDFFHLEVRFRGWNM